jgi:hypothetical protein
MLTQRNRLGNWDLQASSEIHPQNQGSLIALESSTSVHMVQYVTEIAFQTTFDSQFLQVSMIAQEGIWI